MPVPAGEMLLDGFSTIIECSGAPTLSFWEIDVTPPGVEGGGATDVTTMRNTAWRTRAPKHLKTLDDCDITAGYDPVSYNTAVAQVNITQSWKVTMPDLSTVTFWAFLNRFKPNAHREGERPTAALNIIPTNMDTTGAEVAPVYAAPPP